MLRDIPDAGIRGRLAVARLEPASRYIADANQTEGVGYARRLLVQEILSRVGDLGMYGLNPARLVGTLGDGKGSFVSGKHPGVLDLGARRQRHAVLEAQIDADGGVLAMRLGQIFDGKVAIPAAPRVL